MCLSRAIKKEIFSQTCMSWRGRQSPIYECQPDSPQKTGNWKIPSFALSRQSRSTLLESFEAYLRQAVASLPNLPASWLFREFWELGFEGSSATLKPFLRETQPPARTEFERRFEMSPVNRSKSILQNLQSGSLMNLVSHPKSGGFPWPWVILCGSGVALSPVKIRNPSCVTTVRPWSAWRSVDP